MTTLAHRAKLVVARETAVSPPGARSSAGRRVCFAASGGSSFLC